MLLVCKTRRLQAARRRRDPRLSAQDTLGQRYHIVGAVAHGAARETGCPGAAAAP